MDGRHRDNWNEQKGTGLADRIGTGEEGRAEINVGGRDTVDLVPAMRAS